MKGAIKPIIIISSIFIAFLSVIFFVPNKSITFDTNNKIDDSKIIQSTSTNNVPDNDKDTNSDDIEGIENTTTYSTDTSEYFIDSKVFHLKTPKIVKGIYITENTFASASKINNLINAMQKSDVNSAVINVVSDGGPLFIFNKNIAKARLSLLHSKGIYLIARIVTLNDGKGGWYNPTSEHRRWQLVDMARRAIDSGFDEINFDYIRYPGPSEPQIFNVPTEDKIKNITSLFKFIKKNIRDNFNMPISIDIFGSTFIYPEKNIGQNMEEASKYFDYIMPMPYPSHWADGTFGFKKPGEHPYDVVYNSLKSGWDKIKDNRERISQLRAWIQDFNLKSISPITYLKYTPKMVHDQIFACYENNCSGWVLWNPNNIYNIETLRVPDIDPYLKTTTATSTSASSTSSTTRQ